MPSGGGRAPLPGRGVRVARVSVLVLPLVARLVPLRPAPARTQRAARQV